MSSKEKIEIIKNKISREVDEVEARQEQELTKLLNNKPEIKELLQKILHAIKAQKDDNPEDAKSVWVLNPSKFPESVEISNTKDFKMEQITVSNLKEIVPVIENVVKELVPSMEAIKTALVEQHTKQMEVLERILTVLRNMDERQSR